MDLGKSMERLLTLDERTFTRLLLHRKVIDETIDPWAESAYNYMVTQHGAILRSQLDCAIKVSLLGLFLRSLLAFACLPELVLFLHHYYYVSLEFYYAYAASQPPLPQPCSDSSSRAQTEYLISKPAPPMPSG